MIKKAPLQGISENFKMADFGSSYHIFRKHIDRTGIIINQLYTQYMLLNNRIGIID